MNIEHRLDYVNANANVYSIFLSYPDKATGEEAHNMVQRAPAFRSFYNNNCSRMNQKSKLGPLLLAPRSSMTVCVTASLNFKNGILCERARESKSKF